MAVVIKQGGLAPGGFNFDAKLRRESTTPEDLMLAHISGMDTLARGLRAAASLQQDGRLQRLVEDRYASYRSGMGAQIHSAQIGFEELESFALADPPTNAPPASGQQELAERIFSFFV